jgi:hypothetical protein
MNYGRMEQEIVKLRAGIRKQRDATGHDLCWWSELWGLLPEAATVKPKLPPRKEFIAKCGEFHSKLVKSLVKNRT